MKTVIIGGGKGCIALIDLALGGFLTELVLEIECVMDINPDAPGMVYARKKGINTSRDMMKTLSIPDIDLVIELTGRDEVLEEIYKLLPTGIKVIDHTFAHVFWDLVNAQKEQERALKEIIELERKVEKERRFLQSVFDSTPDLVAVLDREKRIIKVNSRFVEFIGKPEEELIGTSCQDLLAGMGIDCECIIGKCKFEPALYRGKSKTLIRVTPPPNETHWEATQTPIFNQKGEIDSILFTWHRITEQVMLRREVQSADQKFKSLIESAHDMISIKDVDGRYMIVNPQTAKSFHLEPIDFIGRKPEEILPPEIARQVSMHDNEVLSSKSYNTYEELIPIDGQIRYYNTVRFPLKDYQGEVIGTCSIARDVTREKELQNQLTQAAKLAAVGKLAAGVAHEINNPLTGVLAFAEDLLEDAPEENDSLRQGLEIVIRETMRCRRIVRNLLDFAKQDKPKFETIDPNRILDYALNLVEKLPTFRDITIRVDRDENIPLVRSDPYQLQQVILNFMINAAEAMNGKGDIRMFSEYDRPRRKCVIGVEDNGPGIPENLIDKIFEPFFSTKGTNGLGLAVSWGIVERHGGTIEVDTAESGGAIFRILLPADSNSG